MRLLERLAGWFEDSWLYDRAMDGAMGSRFWAIVTAPLVIAAELVEACREHWRGLLLFVAGWAAGLLWWGGWG